MSVIDMNAIFNAWCRKHKIYGASNPNFSRVTLSLKHNSVLFSKSKHNKDLKTKVTLDNVKGNARTNALAQIRASLNEKNSDRLIIQRGVIKGLTNAQSHITVRGEGRVFNLDLSNPLHEEFMNQPVPEASERYMGHVIASVEVSYKERKYTDRFQFEIIMSGSVYFQHQGSNMETTILSIIQDLQGMDESVRDVRAETNQAVFTVRGEREYQNYSQPIIDWN